MSHSPPPDPTDREEQDDAKRSFAIGLIGAAVVTVVVVAVAFVLLLNRRHAPTSLEWLKAGLIVALGLFMLAVLAVGWFSMQPIFRLAAGRCSKCGYDRRASDGPCPECGQIGG